jgi:hypothetical protein
MEKNMEVSLLLDFYGELLKDKVRRATELYYNDDLSLSEISLELGITRQGVRDLIKRAELNLYGFEEKLGLQKRFLATQQGLEKIKNYLDDTKNLINSNVQISAINENIDLMLQVVNTLIEEE